MSELHPEYPPVLSGKSSPPEGGTHLPFQEAPRSGSRGESVDYEIGINKETYQNLFVDLPEHDRKSAELISVLDMRYDWVDLYWVYEWIQEEVGNPHDRGWIPKDKEDLFTRTAQSREVLGTDARHGDLNPDRAPEDPMEWEDAIELVHTIVAKYLERRLERVNWSPDD
jgi:hypothetical protein